MHGPNQRFHLLQFWPRLKEACCWPLLSYGKLLLCQLLRCCSVELVFVCLSNPFWESELAEFDSRKQVRSYVHTTFAAIVENQSLQVSGCRLKEHDMCDMSATLFAESCPMSASFLTNGIDNDDTLCIR